MKKTVASMAEKASLPPGVLVGVGDQGFEQANITVFRFSPSDFNEVENPDLSLLREHKTAKGVIWVRVRGLRDPEAARSLGELFQLHPLVLEDVLNTAHGSKLESYDDYLFAVCRRIQDRQGHMDLESSQVNLIMGAGWVISFERSDGMALSPVADRLRRGQGRIRRLGADYLFYALMDVVVDSYFHVIEGMEEELDSLEEVVLDSLDDEALGRIYQLKRQAVQLRKAVWPVREMAGGMLRDDTGLITEEAHPFLRDLYDHSIQVMETVEAIRENLSALMDLSLSRAGNRMNQVMKVLTVIATIFIPLTFIAGVYGMNFKYMPELEMLWAYPAVLLVMAVMAAAMLFFFRLKKWL